MMTDKYLEFH